jgi:HSP20 family protein
MSFLPRSNSFIDKDSKKLHCQVVLPGADPEDVDIQVPGNSLTIAGERTNTRDASDADFLQREITNGSFARSIVLPEGANIGMACWKFRRR